MPIDDWHSLPSMHNATQIKITSSHTKHERRKNKKQKQKQIW